MAHVLEKRVSNTHMHISSHYLQIIPGILLLLRYTQRQGPTTIATGSQIARRRIGQWWYWQIVDDPPTGTTTVGETMAGRHGGLATGKGHDSVGGFTGEFFDGCQ